VRRAIAGARSGGFLEPKQRKKWGGEQRPGHDTIRREGSLALRHAEESRGGPVDRQGERPVGRVGGGSAPVEVGEGVQGWGSASGLVGRLLGRPNVNSLIFYLFKPF
jgi:hypothetical protein